MTDKYPDCEFCCCSDCLNDCKKCMECDDGIDIMASCPKYKPKEAVKA